MTPTAGRVPRPEGPDETGVIVDHAGRVSRYLTDGVDLYRCLGGTLAGASRFVALENCLSLEVVMVPIAELHVRRWRAVIPAGPDLDRTSSAE